MSDKLRATPGPWYAIPKGSNPEEACAMYRIDNRQDAPWENFGQIAYAHKDDAHLIAAAPDLYDALIDARDTIATALRANAPDYFSTPDEICGHLTIKHIDTALAKARGDQ